ncbi:MAG TPA: class I SAM-dependent methyltransferase [Crinalium sp.]|jgi:SAM-dependent methyltransferase
MVDIDATQTPLYARNPLERFSDRANDYSKYRPGYPKEAIALTLSNTLPPQELILADIGAGTGISSRLFADQGATVWAIEPNAAMRDAAQPHPRVQFRDGTAEHTGLPDQSVDIITCCQSFHWFEPIATLQEFHRILKPTGRVVLMWNDRNLDDEFTHRYSDIIRDTSDRSVFDRKDRKSPDALAHSSLFTNFQRYSFANTHQLDLDGLIGMVLSKSYTPREGADYERMVAELRSLYEQWAEKKGRSPESSCVSLSYNTKVYIAERLESQVK